MNKIIFPFLLFFIVNCELNQEKVRLRRFIYVAGDNVCYIEVSNERKVGLCLKKGRYKKTKSVELEENIRMDKVYFSSIAEIAEHRHPTKPDNEFLHQFGIALENNTTGFYIFDKILISHTHKFADVIKSKKYKLLFLTYNEGLFYSYYPYFYLFIRDKEKVVATDISLERRHKEIVINFKDVKTVLSIKRKINFYGLKLFALEGKVKSDVNEFKVHGCYLEP